jgi:hypothetical protein
LTVREFVTKFSGLSGSAKSKAVSEAAGLSGARLADLIQGHDVNEVAVAGLHSAMKAQAKPINPSALGILGEGHLADCLERSYGIDPESIRSKKVAGRADGLPFVLEAAFGVRASDFRDVGSDVTADVVTGVNWSPTLGFPFPELVGLLAEMEVDDSDPVVLLVHLACPRLASNDRGKSRLTLPPQIRVALDTCVRSVARRWRQEKISTGRQERLTEAALRRLRKMSTPRKVSITEAAFSVMEEAYRRASDGTGLANARQVMYAARPLVLELTGGTCWKNSAYFTQRLLPLFQEKNPELTAGWDVVYDDRGRLTEPHTDRQIGLGTVKVRRYISSWRPVQTDLSSSGGVDFDYPTEGPQGRYKFALFLEKEGFEPLLQQFRIASRFDLALMSTKGMTVTASRLLAERLAEFGVTILVLHDFDKTGFSIFHTFCHDTERHRFKNKPRMIDLGLRLADVRPMGLESEPVSYTSKVDPKVRLRECGATDEECDFLVRRRTGPKTWEGQRVELNAMSSRQFIAFLEQKLAEHGVTKVVPDAGMLEAAYRRAHRLVLLNRAIDKVHQEQAEPPAPPADLARQIADKIAGTGMPWEHALARIVHDRNAD